MALYMLSLYTKKRRNIPYYSLLRAFAKPAALLWDSTPRDTCVMCEKERQMMCEEKERQMIEVHAFFKGIEYVSEAAFIL